jgi:hypothetical protein
MSVSISSLPRHLSYSRHSPVLCKVWSERLALTILLLLFAVKGVVPSRRLLGSDCASYYLTARLYRERYSIQIIYEWTWCQRKKDHAGIDRPFDSKDVIYASDCGRALGITALVRMNLVR